MRGRTALVLLALAGVLCGCEEEGVRGAEAQEGRQPRDERQSERARMMDEIGSGIAVMHPTEGSDARGTVRFEREGDRVRVVADLTGLAPGTRHGFHVHELGDCSAPDGESAGGHFDPGDHPHALPPAQPRHAGDLGNLEVGRDGSARLDQRFDTFSIAGERAPVLGRAVIVHAAPDTGRGPTGEAGARLACGVIGVARSQR